MARQFAGTRLTKQWESIGTVNEVFSGDASVVGASFPSLEAQTVLRMLGEYVIVPNGAPTAGDQCEISVGIAVLSTDAAVAGASPDPQSEPDYPWMYWAVHPMIFPTASLDPSSGYSWVRQSFDIRSMRKMKPRESLAMVIQYVDGAGTPGILFQAGPTRILLGVH